MGICVCVCMSIFLKSKVEMKVGMEVGMKGKQVERHKEEKENASSYNVFIVTYEVIDFIYPNITIDIILYIRPIYIYICVCICCQYGLIVYIYIYTPTNLSFI